MGEDVLGWLWLEIGIVPSGIGALICGRGRVDAEAGMCAVIRMSANLVFIVLGSDVGADVGSARGIKLYLARAGWCCGKAV